MCKLGAKKERFQVETIKEFKNESNYSKIERVKDDILRKEWFNVIWYSIPLEIIPIKDFFKFMYTIKSKSYKNKKEAIQHFNKIIKSQIK